MRPAAGVLRGAKVAVLASMLAVLVAVPALGAQAGGSRVSPLIVYVRPGGPGPGSGTRQSPYTSLDAARNSLATRLRSLRTNAVVEMEGGVYHLTRPFQLSAADSGRNGHLVVFQAAPGAHPVISGGYQVKGWHRQAGPGDIYVASVPSWVHTRQLYVDGRRAEVAQGPTPFSFTKTATGYTVSSTALDSWSNPSEIELVYPSGPSNWTETRCRVASISGTSVTMDEPCWDNSTLRGTPGTAIDISGFGQPLDGPFQVTNAYQLLTRPGQWYLNDRTHRLYYIPRPGQDMAKATVIVPRLETLVEGSGNAAGPIHDIEFKGITFSYATWLEPSTPNGYSDFQGGTYLAGPNAYRLQGACDSAAASCPYAAYDQIPGNVTFHDDRHLVFLDDTFVHLGATGLVLGDGSQGDVVEGSVFTDTSGAGLTIGGIDQPLASGTALTAHDTVMDDYFHNTAVEYQDCAAIFVGYAQYTTIEHNQIDDVPYSGISIGWGGWLERYPYLGPLSNYSKGNVIAQNLIFDEMKTLVDGGGIYTNGIEGSSMANAELIEGNVVLEQHHPSWAIYTDNGTQYVRVVGNAVFDALDVPAAPAVLGVAAAFSFGGCGGGPIDYDGNYSIQADPSAGLLSANPSCGGHPLEGVTVEQNHVIASLDQVPASLLGEAGLQEPYRADLRPTPAPTDLPASTVYP